MKPTLALLATALFLTACAAGTTQGAPDRVRTGGSAASMGPTFCHTVPADPNERLQWNNLCFSRR